MTGVILFAVLSQLKLPLTPPTMVEAEGESLSEPTAGSRWGFVSLAGGTVEVGVATERRPLGDPRLVAHPTGLSAVVGLGARYGFRERQSNRAMLMPGIAIVAGTTFATDHLSPFIEGRSELMFVTPGGSLQPNFLVYLATGASSARLGRGDPFSIQPHFGVGIGWNWLPGKGSGGLGGGSGGGAGLVGLPAALAVIGFILAGRVEVRYTARPLTGLGSDFLGITVGFGS